MFRWPKRNILGIDVSDRSLEVIQLKRSFGKPLVMSYGRQKIGGGIVEDGRILKPAALTEALQRLLRQSRPEPIKERLCVLSLPESQVFSHVFSLPSVLSDEQVRRAILLEAEQFIPIPLRECYYDFYTLGKFGDLQEVCFVATRRGVVHQYLETFRSAGLLPVVFEPESSSLVRALVRRGFGDRGSAVVMLDIGARTTNAHLIRQGQVIGSLTIPRAGSHFTAAVAAALKLDSAAAETKKCSDGVDEHRGSGEVFSAMVPVLEPIVNEIRRYIAYAGNHRKLTVRQIVLTGGSVLLPGMPEYLSLQLGCPAAVGNPLSRLRFGRVALPAGQTALYANVIGLALRGMSKDPVSGGLNLLSQARDRLRSEQIQNFLKPPKMDRQMIALLVAFGAVLVVLGGLVWYRFAASHTTTRPASLDQPPIDWENLRAPKSLLLQFYYGNDRELPTGTIRGRLLEQTLTVTRQFDVTETMVAPATDITLRLYNRTGEAQTLAPQAVLRNVDGASLALLNQVVIPARGSVEVKIPVTAGISLSAGRLTIEGAPPSLQNNLYGELTPPYTGKPTAVKVVKDSDISAAQTALSLELDRRAQVRFVGRLDVGEFLLPIAIPLGADNFFATPKVGTATAQMKTTLSQRVGGLVTPEKALVEEILKQFPGIQDPLKSVSFELDSQDLEKQQISVILKSTGPVEK